jgi:hypothetical protein
VQQHDHAAKNKEQQSGQDVWFGALGGGNRSATEHDSRLPCRDAQVVACSSTIMLQDRNKKQQQNCECRHMMRSGSYVCHAEMPRLYACSSTIMLQDRNPK